jgi:hypothetical protein
MEEQILELLKKNYYPLGEMDDDEICAREITIMIDEFIEWCATTHFKLHKVWCGLYKDQRNQANWKTTEELFIFWNTNIRNK